MRPATPFQKDAITVAEIVEHVRTLARIEIGAAQHRPGRAAAADARATSTGPGWRSRATPSSSRASASRCSATPRSATSRGSATAARGRGLRDASSPSTCRASSSRPATRCPRRLLALADARGVPVYAHAHADGPVHAHAARPARGPVRAPAHAPRLARGRLRHRAAHHRPGRHRQVRDRPRLGRARPPPRRRRRRHRDAQGRRTCSWGPARTSPSTSWRSAAWASSTSRPCSACAPIRYQKRIEVVVRVHPWDPDEEYTRIGMVDENQDILDVPLPLVKLPVTPGKNVTVLCEVIAMNHLLRHYGYDSADEFAQRLQDQIARKRAGGAACHAARRRVVRDRHRVAGADSEPTRLRPGVPFIFGPHTCPPPRCACSRSASSLVLLAGAAAEDAAPLRARPRREAAAPRRRDTTGSRPLRLRAVGDVMIGTDFPAGYLPPRGRSVLTGVHDLLRDADLTFANLEGPFLDGGALGQVRPRVDVVLRLPHADVLRPLPRRGRHRPRVAGQQPRAGLRRGGPLVHDAPAGQPRHRPLGPRRHGRDGREERPPHRARLVPRRRPLELAQRRARGGPLHR